MATRQSTAKIRRTFTPYDLTCEYCRCVVHIEQAHTPPRRFCSISCARRANTQPTHIALPKVTLICQHKACGQEFLVKHNRAYQAQYCSRACAGAAWRAATFERFMARVTITPTCWLWTGATDKFGYGRVGVARKIVLTHRYSYEMHRGPIPVGLVLDHLCRTPRCVNPDHLEPVTLRENIERSPLLPRTHCPRGHVLDESNLDPDRLRRGLRLCRICREEQVQRARVKQNARQRAIRAAQRLTKQ